MLTPLLLQGVSLGELPPLGLLRLWTNDRHWGAKQPSNAKKSPRLMAEFDLPQSKWMAQIRFFASVRCASQDTRKAAI